MRYCFFSRELLLQKGSLNGILTSCVSLFALTVKITFIECRIQAYPYN